MKKWIVAQENMTINVDAIELIEPHETGSLIHLSCGEKRWVKQSPAVLLNEIRETNDSITNLKL